MHTRTYLPLVAALALFAAVPARAEKVIWHYDNLPSAMEELANGLKQHPMYAHPGFVKGEAFGVLFKPKPTDYPVKILTVEFVMAQAEGQKDQKGDFNIEFYNDDGNGPAPKGPPIYNVSTKDFAQNGTIGFPVVGNNGMIYQFDWTKPENHPPEIQSGNIYLVIRFLNDTSDLSQEWGKMECAKIDLGVGLEACGCQHLAALTEQKATIPGVNLMNIVWPVGTCSGNKQWKFVEQVATANLEMKGNFLLRMGVEGTGGGNPPDSDGGSTTGPDAGSTQVDTGTTAGGPPEISGVTPSSGPADKPVSIDVYGKNFQKGLVCKLGSEPIQVKADSITSSGFSATVVGIAAGTYDLVVKNPDGQVAFKSQAYTVQKAAADDAGTSAETAQPSGQISLEAVSPSCVVSSQDTLITVLGLGFVKGVKVSVGPSQLQAVDILTPGKLQGLLPKGMATGEYTVIATWPNGDQKAFPNAIRVGVGCGPASTSSSSGSSCSARPVDVSGWMALAALCAAAGLIAVRRVRP